MILLETVQPLAEEAERILVADHRHAGAYAGLLRTGRFQSDRRNAVTDQLLLQLLAAKTGISDREEKAVVKTP